MEHTSSPASTAPPPLPARKTTKGKRRREGCTHLTMSRIYDSHGMQKCEMCHRSPSMGWLYRCTQDYNGFLPSDHFSSEHSHDHADIKPSQDPILNCLNSWITKGIENGYYTEEQVLKFREQKLGVKACVVAAEQRNADLRHQDNKQQSGGLQRRSLPLRPLLQRVIAPPPRLSLESALPRRSSHFARGALDTLPGQSTTALQKIDKTSEGRSTTDDGSPPHTDSLSSSTSVNEGETSSQATSSLTTTPVQTEPYLKTRENIGDGQDAPQSAPAEESNHPSQTNTEEGSDKETGVSHIKPSSYEDELEAWRRHYDHREDNDAGLDIWRRQFDQLEDAFKGGRLNTASHLNETTHPLPSSSITAESQPRESESLMNQLQNTNIAITMTAEPKDDPQSAQYPDICKHIDCQPYNSLQPKCNYSVCPACRQSFRERSFTSLNQALANGPSELPNVPPWELSNRPVSPAQVVRQLGTMHQSAGSSNSAAAGSNTRSIKFGREGVEDLRQRLRAARKMFSALPNKVKNVVTRQSPIDSESSSSESSREVGDNDLQNPQSEMPRRQSENEATGPATEEQANNEIDELWEAAWCGVAIHTPLPESSSDEDSDSSSEVEVAGGVAVTEEGVTLHNPDIIMQA